MKGSNMASGPEGGAWGCWVASRSEEEVWGEGDGGEHLPQPRERVCIIVYVQWRSTVGLAPRPALWCGGWIES